MDSDSDSSEENGIRSFAMNAYFQLGELKEINYESWLPWECRLKNILNMLHPGLLKEDKPDEPTDTSSPEERVTYERWVRSNCSCADLIKGKMSQNVYSELTIRTQSDNAREILGVVKDMVMFYEKLHAPSTLKKLVTMRYDGDSDVFMYLLKMENIVRKLKFVDVLLPGYLVNQLALNSLPSEFEPVQIQYIVAKQQWEWHELQMRCRIAEERSRLMRSVREKANVSCNGKNCEDWQGNGAKKGREFRCYSCGQKGHKAKNCQK